MAAGLALVAYEIAHIWAPPVTGPAAYTARMNKFLLSLVIAAIAASAAFAPPAHAQWKWKDATGRVQYSDRPPPDSVPDAAIIARPSGATRARSLAAASPTPAATTAKAAAPAKDPQLEARRREMKEAEDAKKRAEQEQIARQREENCGRARSYAKSLEDGIRIVRPNDKGEREFLDDKQRAQELQRAKQVIASDCK